MDFGIKESVFKFYLGVNLRNSCVFFELEYQNHIYYKNKDSNPYLSESYELNEIISVKPIVPQCCIFTSLLILRCQDQYLKSSVEGGLLSLMCSFSYLLPPEITIMKKV